MFESDYFDDDFDESEDSFPDFFDTWDTALNEGQNPGYYDVDELCDIVNIYLSEGEIEKAKQSINYAFILYPENEDLIMEILILLNDYEMWNDLLIYSEKYSDFPQTWVDSHKISALLHLGMEEDAFNFFGKAKERYAPDEEGLFIIYATMAESLFEVDLFDASIDVAEEAIGLLGELPDFLWILLQCYLALKDRENTLIIAEKIQKKEPLDPETWSRLGNAYKEIGEMEKAIEAFEFEHSLGDISSNDLMQLIQAYEKNGNIFKALEKLDEYLTLHPESSIVNLMGANYCFMTEDWNRALQYADKALSLSPEMGSLYILRSEILLKMGEFRKAILTLEDGLSKTKDSRKSLLEQIHILRTQYPD